MAKREYKLTKRCAHEGCTEIGRWTYETVRDLQTSFENKNEYRCVRHSSPNSVLGSSNTTTEKILLNKSMEGLPGLYWDGYSGFIFGPGFKAFANDFPEGTRLVVTARIEFP